ncbi:MAG: translation initiation inhibitor [Planctomycetes bacterium]|nr:translation initiation inhibitor [Planctomycetota bacterium]
MINDETKGTVNLQKRVSSGLEIIKLDRKTAQEYFITAVPEGDECVESLIQRVAKAVHECKAQVVSQEVFGVLDKNNIIQRLKDALGKYEGPVTWLEDGHAMNLYGTHIWAVSGIPVNQLEQDGRIVGSLFDDEKAQYCHLSGLLPKTASRPRSEQAAEIFEQMDGVLKANEMDFNDVLRTWFYNDNILDWYGDFNKVRDIFFNKKQVYEGLVPASTGVGGRNPAGTALVGALLAVKAKSEGVMASAVKSPLQSPALEYGSSFSRAVELDLSDHQRLYISGTASIDPDGTTVHVDDPQEQVELTMKVVHVILESRDMGWIDVTRALAYFKHAKDATIFDKFCTLNNVPPLPVVIAENDICREELLFEIELDAIKTK